MDSPHRKVLIVINLIDMCRPLAVRAEAAPSGLGELTPAEGGPP